MYNSVVKCVSSIRLIVSTGLFPQSPQQERIYLCSGSNLDYIPSLLPPTKSIPSSIALSINGVEAVISSETILARLHNASETFCGSKGGRSGAGGEGGGVKGLTWVEAKCDNSSSMSATYFHQC